MGSRRTHRTRALVVALTTGLALAATAGEASAHRLPVAKARVATADLARAVFADPELRDMGAVDYTAGGCSRRGDHGVKCVFAIVFDDGYLCGSSVMVRFADVRSHRVRARALDDAVCVDEDPGVVGPAAEDRAARVERRRDAAMEGGRVITDPGPDSYTP